ncbi:hypothetical protein GQX74_011935 [Glossina fuscipes]|nr:hypothetical protein GQX74_011935 [Glossina fuscipes]
MEEVKVDISGDMNVPLTSTKSQFDFASLNQWQKLPSPMEILQLVRKSIRPWSEFINTSNFKTAASMQRLTARFVRNLDYFKSNYIFVFIVLMIYCLITSPLILLVLVAVAAASHKIRQLQASVSIFGHQLSTSHQIMAINIASLPILFLVGAGSALFWTLGIMAPVPFT